MKEEVYDLLNCGPRQQFAVFQSDTDYMIVHNCVQATAYDVLAWQAAQILKEEGHGLTLFVHDELAYTDEQGKEDYWERVLTKWMRTPPPWLPDIPLDCDFGHGKTYADV